MTLHSVSRIGACVAIAALPFAFHSAQAQDSPAVEPAATENVCARPAPNPFAASCSKWAAFLGRWTTQKYGGVFEVILGPDRKLHATVVGLNDIMRRNGFLVGMPIMRNYEPKVSSLTWLFAAERGDYFIPVQPGRKPGEPYGTPHWGSSVIYITKAEPNRLAIPATLENRMSNYAPWTRMAEPQAN